jgi:glycosyltransferase involved in cell wall biosynthesis
VKVDFYTRYSAGAASARQRFIQFIPGLREAGIEASNQSLLSDDHLERLHQGRRARLMSVSGSYLRRLGSLLHHARSDLAVVQYEFWPYLPACFERLMEIRYPKYIVDYDDAWFLTYRNRLGLRGKLEKVMARAIAVTVGNSYLAEYARQYTSRIEIFPTTVDIEKYLPRPRPGDGKELVIGWMGSPTTAPNLRLIEDALAILARERKVRVRCIGPAADFALPGVSVEKRRWLEEQEVEEIQQFDIGINPLVDNDFTRGKCGYKLIQYMACEVPVVASPVGANCEIVEQGKNGYLATDRDEWIDALRRLADDSDLRLRLGQSGRRKVIEKYSLQAVLPRMISLYREMVEGTH